MRRGVFLTAEIGFKKFEPLLLNAARQGRFVDGCQRPGIDPAVPGSAWNARTLSGCRRSGHGGEVDLIKDGSQKNQFRGAGAGWSRERKNNAIKQKRVPGNREK